MTEAEAGPKVLEMPTQQEAVLLPGSIAEFPPSTHSPVPAVTFSKDCVTLDSDTARKACGESQ